MTVALGTSNSKFSAAVNSDNDISVSGTVKGGNPYLTAVGSFDVDLAVEVSLHALLCGSISSLYSSAQSFHKSIMHQIKLDTLVLAKRAATKPRHELQLACKVPNADSPIGGRHQVWPPQ